MTKTTKLANSTNQSNSKQLRTPANNTILPVKTAKPDQNSDNKRGKTIIKRSKEVNSAIKLRQRKYRTHNPDSMQDSEWTRELKANLEQRNQGKAAGTLQLINCKTRKQPSKSKL